MEQMSDHLHSKVSAQEVRISGIESRLTGVENAVVDGFNAVNAKLDNQAATAKPTTHFVLWMVGGLITMTMLLFINPLREKDAKHDEKFDKLAEVSLSLVKSDSRVAEQARNNKDDIIGHGYDIREHDKELSELYSRVSVIEERSNDNKNHLQTLTPRVDKAEADNKGCETDRANIRVWLGKVDNIGTRNEVNRH